MPRRSKPTSGAANDAESTTTSSGIATPTRPEVQLRRSNRRLAQDTREEDNTREIQGRVMGIRPEGEERRRSNTSEDRQETVKEGVQLAIEGLARMERRLQKATKKQKTKVEASVFREALDPRHDDDHDPVILREVILRDAELVDHIEEGGPFAKDDTAKKAKRSTLNSEDVNNPDGPYAEVKSEDTVEIERGAARAPPVNSSYLPLPWRGRLGYACLNTYLRSAKVPVFSSRTCRMASIVEHRHPLADETQPEHPTKNRPDQTKKANMELGQKFVQGLGLANARDIIKMLRWNEKYGIKFMRLSSEMFPFASHPEHGYQLAPFASEVLAEVGKVAAELGHRLTTHPGQFTQLGSPRKEVITASIRDLEYHDEMLSLLRLPEQQNRDAIMILHMGGVYGDKAATLDRFRENYAGLSASIKARLVLENDDVAWSVHDLLPICEELNIPLVLDYHHHNIIFDSEQCREGTLDISQPEISDRIAATWSRKGIKQKMHYSEPCDGMVTRRDRRKHSPRVRTLPPCSPDMDLMIEAKDKEQAVFELMRTFKLPGFERANDIIPHERTDENRPAPKVAKSKNKGKGGKRKRAPEEDEMDGAEAADEGGEAGILCAAIEVSEEDRGMGGPENRVYWPLGNEDWLKPKKREGKAKAAANGDDD
ncbi:UV-endonuclease UvdE-domain-containing protein [Cercophora newfieldiana]|uniref:UV-endonuclease UvdE-domain-containing protein n=1 Tax=Cercophora newfieldiana TaxID=92897 RepID=A0AA40CIN9_9PEZI|nr:UV-endonuclease UvdE-domain-containing protein [Cercophora newfieldiana]